jgi:hypothetical protein
MKLSEAQQNARTAILRDVVRSGGIDTWAHLHSHGHHIMQVRAAVNRGDLTERPFYHYQITEAGRAALGKTP